MSKIALVTGASRGIGQEILLNLFKAGYRVVGTASTEAGCEKINEISDKHENCLALHGNLKDGEACVNGWLSAIEKHYNASPDIVIANAGVTKDNLLVRMDSNDWQDVLSINLTANFHLAKCFIRPMMKKRFGRFVFMGSVSANGNPGQANYASSKAGICGLSRSIAIEYGARNITSNVVSPGFIKTDMTDQLSDDQQTNILENIPLQRYGNVNEVADLVSFLISDKANYITGQTIHINGGMFTS